MRQQTNQTHFRAFFFLFIYVNENVFTMLLCSHDKLQLPKRVKQQYNVTELQALALLTNSLIFEAP
jgi:hypothetical protein